ncbi:hypothetical protein COEREDRAFT_11860 [Coemansia reversa NRRL 1564]|uniref:Uncharacterized protein n=1 Tax=Coemansia reversa (strain ATCC 12441 / NRRL 1564) TaxID=763665 RepID=A0A2G5B1W4_COERN|nr:hypothetical protein COEREDRAFT_11860 [Coemansia reversa NRRL 1564]|eukprot:PIA12994.1 hypothetical protein COEREDRAFT_11860 [Coemansia reversa NRRL 1564]
MSTNEKDNSLKFHDTAVYKKYREKCEEKLGDTSELESSEKLENGDYVFNMSDCTIVCTEDDPTADVTTMVGFEATTYIINKDAIAAETRGFAEDSEDDEGSKDDESD